MSNTVKPRRYAEFILSRMLHIVDVKSRDVLCAPGITSGLSDTSLRSIGQTPDIIPYCEKCVKNLLERVA